MAGVIPNDPSFSQQWPLHNTGQTGGLYDADIDMPEAWSVSTGSMSTVIAVLDSGIDYTHPDVYLNIWINESEIPAAIASNLTDSDSDGVITFRDLDAPANTPYVSDLNGTGYIDAGDLLNDPRWENGLDEDGNGFVDDLVGWDFHDDDNDPYASLAVADHGTHISQRLAATGNDGVGWVGVMWQARLMQVRINLNNSPGNWSTENCAAGIDYAVAEGASISNNSWLDEPYSQLVYDAIDRARFQNHLFIAAAGNRSQDNDTVPFYPASYDLDNVISVAALNASDQLSSVTNWGKVSVDLGAPSDTGATSKATPIVTGVAGLLRTLHPDWTYTQIKDRILSTVDPVPALAGKSVTGGRLNAANALGVAQFSISDATATEGSGAMKYIDDFVSANSGGLRTPRGVVFGPEDGMLYVATGLAGQSEGDSSNQILRFDALTGAFVDVAFTSGDNGVFFDLPWDMTFGPDNQLYVSARRSHNILRYDPSTDTLEEFVPETRGVYRPCGLAFGPDGNLYVSNADNGTTSDSSLLQDQIVRFAGPFSDQPGEPLGVFISDELLDNNQPILFYGNYLYIGNFRHSNQGNVLRYTLEGEFDREFIANGSGGLTEPSYLSFHAGNLFVNNQSRGQILEYDASGTFVTRVVDVPLEGAAGFAFDDEGKLYVGFLDGRQTSSNADDIARVRRYARSSLAAFTISLNSPSATLVTVDYATANGSALASSDYTASSGTITFAPGQTSRTILVQTLDDAVVESNETFTVILGSPVGGVIVDGQGVGTIVDNDIPPTKFYVVDDGSTNRMFEYAANGSTIENYSVASGNTAPRGAASNIAGDKTWVVDANKKVYVYGNSGALLGSWTAGSLASNATVEGIATNGTDIWIVDARQDRVYRYNGAASRLSGSQNAVSSFALNSGNRDPKDIVTDGVHLWVVNNSTTDKVFKYTVGGSFQGSWTITSGGGSPTGITIDPTNVSDIWIVDNATDRVYQFYAAASRTSGSQSPATSFALAAGNTNPQGIADPPAVVGDGTTTSASDSTTATNRRASHWRSQWHTAIDSIFAANEHAVWRRRGRVTR